MSDRAEPTNENLLALSGDKAMQLGWLAHDLPFLTRTLRVLLRPQSDVLRHDLGLEPGEIGVLAVINHNPGLSQNDLAASVVLKKSAVTKLIQQLERRGLVQRSRSASDRRSNELNLTEAGEALCARMHRLSQAQHEEWFDGIDPADQAVFFDVLSGLIRGLTPHEAGIDRTYASDD